MRGALPHSYYIFFFFFLVLALFRHVYSTNTLSSTETLTISSNRTIVSPGNVFELGFFKTTTSCSRNGDRWYLGIWYKSISKRTYVWVANRDNPLSCSTGTLKIAYTNLALLDHSGTPVWSTNLTKAVKSPVVAELLDNGNFVLRDSKSNCPNRYLWQSFDYPVDTLLPEIKLGRDLKTGRNKFLTSWKSPNDPSSGDLSFKLETKGVPEFYLYKKEFIVYRSCPWNGVGFSRMPTMQKWYVVNNFIETRDEVAYSFKVPNHKTYTRFTLTSEGLLQMFAWIPTLSEWNLFWTLPTENCDLYKVCGSYSYCDMKTSPKCNCIRGFVPKNATAWALRETFYECVRKSRLSCRRDGSIFIFILVSYIFYNSDSQNRKSHKTSRENFSFTALRRLEHQSDSQLDEHKCSISVCFLEWP